MTHSQTSFGQLDNRQIAQRLSYLLSQNFESDAIDRELAQMMQQCLHRSDMKMAALVAMHQALRASHLGNSDRIEVDIRKAIGYLENLPTFDSVENALLDKFAQKQFTLSVANHIPKTWGEFNERFHVQHPAFFSLPKLCAASLTGAELRVCMLLSKDYAPSFIANILGISSKTLNNHRLKVRSKFSLTRKENLQAFCRQLL